MDEPAGKKFIAELKDSLIPFYAYLDVTYKCNLSCPHCVVRLPKRFMRKKEMSLGQIRFLLEELAKAGTTVLNLSGGEPLFRKDFFDITKYARELGFACELFTNGTLITEETADKLASLNLTRVNVCLYGATKESFGRITKRPYLFTKTIKGIELLAARRINTSIRSLLLRDNTIEDITGIKKIAEKLRVEHGTPTAQILPNRLTSSLFPLRQEPTLAQLEAFSRLYPEFFKFKLKTPDETLKCGRSKDSIYIDAYGGIGTCYGVRTNKTIKDGASLLEIWRKEKTFNALRKLKWGDLSRCKNCGNRSFCFVCPGISLMLCNNLKGPPPKIICRLAKNLRYITQKNSRLLSQDNPEKNLC